MSTALTIVAEVVAALGAVFVVLVVAEIALAVVGAVRGLRNLNSHRPINDDYRCKHDVPVSRVRCLTCYQERMYELP